jgi:hypothetical protein
MSLFIRANSPRHCCVSLSPLIACKTTLRRNPASHRSFLECLFSCIQFKQSPPYSKSLGLPKYEYRFQSQTLPASRTVLQTKEDLLF